MFTKVPDSRRNSSDRFIPRRANVNFDLSYHYINQSNESVNCVLYSGTGLFTNSAKRVYNLEQYRSKLWKAVMPKENKILVFSSPKKITKRTAGENREAPLWPVHPRSKPLLEPPSVILDMPDLDTNIAHHVVDWGKKGYIGTIYENEVHLWHPDDNLRRHVTVTNKRVQSCLKWNTEGTEFAIALNKACIAMCDFSNFKTTQSSTCLCSYRICVVTAMHFTRRNCLITGCSNGRLCVWTSYLVCTNTYYAAHVNGIITIELSCNENYLATTGKDRKVKIWKWPTLQQLFEMYFPEAPVKAVAWHPWRDSFLVIGGPDATTLWNVSTLKSLASKNHPHGNCLVDCLTFNPLSAELVASYFVLTDNGDPVQVLSVLKDLNHIVDEALFHEGRVPYLLWDASGTKLATASADENLCIWDFFGTSADLKKKYSKLSRKKELSADMMSNLNIFNSYIR